METNKNFNKFENGTTDNYKKSKGYRREKVGMDEY